MAAVGMLMLCGLVLRLFTSADAQLHKWDERYHALVAKNLTQHPLKPTLYDNPVLPYDYRQWSGNHVWVHKQPLPLWGIAVSIALFGTHELAVRLPSILLTTLGIWLMFRIGLYFYNQRIAYLAAFFYTINGLIIEITAGRIATDHIDVFFAFFIQAAVWFSLLIVQHRNMIFSVLTGFCIGAAILCKWLPALIVFPIWLFVVWDARLLYFRFVAYHGTVILLCATAIALPWQVYIWQAFPAEAQWESAYNLRHIFEVLGTHAHPYYYFLERMRINYGELIYLPLLWFLWKLLKNPSEGKRWALAVWFLIPLAFFTWAKTKLQAYTLFTAPALFLITAEFFFVLRDYPHKQPWKWVAYGVLVLLIALPVRYTFERVKPLAERDGNPAWVSELEELNEQAPEKGILFHYPNPIEAMFYTDLTVYSALPERETLLALIDQGYPILINACAPIPPEVQQHSNVTIVHLTCEERQ